MAPPLLSEISLVLVLAAMFLLPGSAVLVLSRAGQHWKGLQQYIVAVGLSLSFFPILFYGTRFLFPAARLGSNILWLILALSLGVTIWGIWQQKVFSLRLDRLEWAAVAVLVLTLLSRFWFANVHPFPAWSDSLHHTLLTDLTAVNGRLPHTLEPYFPNRLGMYHLGLYALSGTAQMLTSAPAYSALLWTAQFLNGLCGLGIYFVLDRYAGRTGAIVGLAVAGLFSAHPALWANWGRFTQLASLIVLPISWTIFLDTLLPQVSKPTARPHPSHSTWMLLFATITTVAVFFYHFRVAVFYILLIGITLVWILLKDSTRPQRITIIKYGVIIGGVSLFLILPVLWDAATVFFAKRAVTVVPANTELQQQSRQSYYVFPLESIPYLAAPIWLLTLTGLAGLLGIIKRSPIIIINFLWVLLLIGLGNLYLLNIPALNITNLGAILIMLYLPISIIIGTGIELGLKWLPEQWSPRATAVFIPIMLLACLPAAWNKANLVEPYRHFVTEDDIAAMAWINDNIPTDATFAINTYFWLPAFAHGTDAGYWIPYFTHRHIVTSAMLTDGLSADFRQQILAQSQAAEALATDVTAVTTLYDMGVQYIYIGAHGDFSGPGLQLTQLMQSDRVKLLYQHGGAAILQIKPPE